LQFIIDGIFGDAHLSISMPIVSLMRVQSSRINRRQKANAAQGTIFISGFRKKILSIREKVLSIKKGFVDNPDIVDLIVKMFEEEVKVCSSSFFSSASAIMLRSF
jgi:DNA primase large subunit